MLYNFKATYLKSDFLSITVSPTVFTLWIINPLVSNAPFLYPFECFQGIERG